MSSVDHGAVNMRAIAFGMMLTGLVVSTPATAEDVRAAIEEVNANFMAAYEAGDAATAASFYTEDAKLLPPDAAEITGRKSIQEMWQGWIDAGLKNVKLEVVEVEGAGATGV